MGREQLLASRVWRDGRWKYSVRRTENELEWPPFIIIIAGMCMYWGGGLTNKTP